MYKDLLWFLQDHQTKQNDNSITTFQNKTVGSLEKGLKIGTMWTNFQKDFEENIDPGINFRNPTQPLSGTELLNTIF